MKVVEIREAFLKFFEEKSHARVASSSLVTTGDPTLLFANSGMVQFKDCFLGTDKRAYTRATTCQKSLRISGKHNDLENVGRTSRHHTFFEMLGNFSFGDYFKRDAILFAWEFLTQVLKLPKDRLWVTVYKDDDDALKLWGELTDVLPGRVLKFDEKDNFWAMGETGPCGPCSEIFYYTGNNLAGQSEAEFRSTDGVYIEIWNLVFMQYNRDISGAMTPLPKPSVDTGSGLERVAAVKQGVLSNYDIDLMREIISFTEKLSGKTYLGKDYTERNPEEFPDYASDVAFRVICDHSRAAAFLIADGVSPGSDGRGYVLRRIIRRACRHGRVLGLKDAFLFRVAGEVIRLMSPAYPELSANLSKIEKLIRGEEEKFIETLDTGLSILNKEVRSLKSVAQKVFPGRVAFELHDTFGFPLDLTEDLLRHQGLAVDVEAFTSAMDEQRERSRSARAQKTDLILQKAVKQLPSKFVGYEFNEYQSTVSGLFIEEGEVKVIKAGAEVAVVCAETPFYAESGGQIGDTGALSSNNASLDVLDTQKIGAGTIVHICRVKEGELQTGEDVRLEIAQARRHKLRINHSATHLVHAALREVLGSHVKQAGSRVSDQTLRFDFSHFEAATEAQLREIETIANQLVQENSRVETDVLPIEEAKKVGAVALFGEKYGDLVRVVTIGPRSKEFCGGTHAQRSGDIGFISLLAESGISAGVRRIEAYAGTGALNSVLHQKAILRALSAELKSSEAELVERVAKLLDRVKDSEKQLERASSQSVSQQGEKLSEKATTLADGTKVLASRIENIDPKALREIADSLKARLGSGCIALAGVHEGKVVILTAVSDDLTSKFHAGKLMTEITKVLGAKGGGRADLAQAGGGDPAMIDQALSKFQELVKQ